MNRSGCILAALVALASGYCTSSVAGNLDQIGTLTQSQFQGLSTDLGAAAAYKGVTPATPLGLVGFDLGIELTRTDVKHAAAFSQAGAGDLDYLFVPKLHITAGLPYKIDIGAFLSQISSTGGSLIGAEMRYAFLDDTVATPAIAVRLSGTRLTGVSQLGLSTVALDAMLSKKLTFVTPYAGIGAVRTQSKASAANLTEETINKSRAFVGLNANFLLANLAVEAEKLGDNTSLSAKFGFRF